MFRALVYCIGLIVVAGSTVWGEEAANEGDKLLGGMSIVGNDEAPKSLVIVPWKSLELGDTLDVSRILDDGRKPVDREVFMRELDYYQIRAGTPTGRAPATP